MKKLFGLLATASLVAGGALLSVGGTASAQGLEPVIELTVEKEVVNSDLGDFEIDVECEDDEGATILDEEIELDHGDDETLVVLLEDVGQTIGTATCTVEEDDGQGAVVTYECDEGRGASCDEDESSDPAEVDFNLEEWDCCPARVLEATVTVVNTFEEPTTTTLAPATVPTTAARPAAAAVARARFTG